MTLFLLNRDPEPSEQDVTDSSDILLDIVDTSGLDIDLSATQVIINGVLVFDAGTFQPMFNGPNSSTSSVATGVRRVRIDPQFAFDSLQVFNVRVISQNDAAIPETIDETYTFIGEDKSAPIIESASGTSGKVVRVVFAEDVKMVSASSSDDALNPANYSIERQIAPSVSVEVASVAQVSSRAVDLTLDIDTTHGAEYLLTASNVEDLWGNSVAAPFNMATFVGFTPTIPDNRDFDLYQMLANMNRREDLTEDLLKFVACLQEVSDKLLFDIDAFQDILDPDTAPEQYLDAMLVDLGNPFSFAASLDLVDKRRLVRTLVDIYRQKGTGQGIINVIRFFLAIEVELLTHNSIGMLLGISELGVDWELATSSQYMRYAFDVISPVSLTDTQRTQMTSIVEYMKPAHTHLRSIIEPTVPVVIDHLELGLSELGGDEWQLH